MSEKQLVVNFEGGEGRHTNAPVNYMICNLGNGAELYAERALTGEGENFDEGEWYDELRNDIIGQAKEKGIDESELNFAYDDVYLAKTEEHDVATHGFPGKNLVTDTRRIIDEQNMKDAEALFASKKEEILKCADEMFSAVANDSQKRLLYMDPKGELSVHVK